MPPGPIELREIGGAKLIDRIRNYYVKEAGMYTLCVHKSHQYCTGPEHGCFFKRCNGSLIEPWQVMWPYFPTDFFVTNAPCSHKYYFSSSRDRNPSLMTLTILSQPYHRLSFQNAQLSSAPASSLFFTSHPSTSHQPSAPTPSPLAMPQLLSEPGCEPLASPVSPAR